MAALGERPAPPEDLWSGNLFEQIFWVNVVMLVFNLVPAFPMDGGRALRALLATRLSYLRATRTAATLGQACAIAFGLLGLLSNPFLVLIGVFVWIGAAGELALVELRSALHDVRVEQAMLTEFRTVLASDPLSRAVDLTLSGSQKDFPVLGPAFEGGQLIGVLGQPALVSALARHGAASTVGSAMAEAPTPVGLRDPLGPVVERLQAQQIALIPVVHRGALAGIVTSDNVFELLRFRSALEAPRKRPSARLRGPTQGSETVSTG
jgi:CBS domain-containing protein